MNRLRNTILISTTSILIGIVLVMSPLFNISIINGYFFPFAALAGCMIGFPIGKFFSIALRGLEEEK